jgi:GTP-binding protein
LRVRVPVGTQIYDNDTGELIADLNEADREIVIAKGGKGGRGNMHFATPHDRAPRRAEPGGEGEHKKLRLELKLLADVGVVGFPNVGKSTFIAAVSRARPKIADYPFTTLTPNLGVVSLGDDRSFVIADIPGIIEGASEGVGLGLRFLKHVERTRVLLHIVALDIDPARSMLRDFEILIEELRKFDLTLLERPVLVAINKLDLPEAQALFEETKQKLESKGFKVLGMSTATRDGVDAVLVELERLLDQHPRHSAPAAESRPHAVERPHGNQSGFPKESEPGLD